MIEAGEMVKPALHYVGVIGNYSNEVNAESDYKSIWTSIIEAFAAHKEQIKKDLHIEHDELNYEAIRTPAIHHTYNKMLMGERLALKKLEREWDVLYLSRWEYYRKKSDPEVYEKKPLLKNTTD